MSNINSIIESSVYRVVLTDHYLVYASTDINVIVEQWTNVLALIILRRAPILGKRISERYSAWITPHLKRMIRSRDKSKIEAEEEKNQRFS